MLYSFNRIRSFHQPQLSEEKRIVNFMNLQAMVVGYIADLALVGWIGWYAVAALRRRHATREYRAHERAKAKVQAAPVEAVDLYDGEPIGHC